MRGVLAVLLAIVGIVLVPLADVGVWTRLELLPRDRLVSLADKVLDEDEVQVALAEKITDEIDDRVDLSRRARSIVEPAVEHGLTTGEFRVVYERAVGDVHDQIEHGDDRLVLRLDPLLPLIRRTVARSDRDVAADLRGAEVPEITIITQHDVPMFFRAVRLVRRASLVFPIACLVFLAAAVVLAFRRAVMVIVIGAVVVVLSLALVGLVSFARGLLSSVSGPELELRAFEAGYDVVTRSFVLQTLGLAILGAVVVVGGVLLKIRGVRNARPLGWA